jgi:chromate reductase, NAD(P)H dehydrogenase (quinone)
VRILAIPGSLRVGSYNAALARAARDVAPAGVEVEVYEGLARLPHYDQDLDERSASAPPGVRALRERIEEADALLFVTPEYNGSVPGVLKNAIDWVSRPLATNALRNKPVCVIGASTGMFGAVWAQAELRKVLAACGARVHDDEVPVGHASTRFDQDGGLTDEAVSERLAEVVSQFCAECSRSAVAAAA